jgi:processive 1,2-diacylglycerol beta-glucosyltransferase
MSSPPTIAVVHASVGSGHRIAAESIAAELQSLVPDARIEVLDILSFGSVRISGDRATTAFTGPTAPLYNALWGNAVFGRASMAVARPVLGLFYRRFAAWLKEQRPAAIVTTHGLAANLAVRAVRKLGLSDTAVIAAATDYGLHGFWPRRGLDLFCVADEAEREELQRRGTPDSDIRVTGISVRAQFADEIDSEAAHASFDLPTDRRVVLALAGATQPGPYARFKASLAVSLPAIASVPGTMVAVVTGRDDGFAEELRVRVAGFGTTNVSVLGYVDRMAQLMSAADVVVCKPGGLVTAECAAIGVPMVLVGPAVGQERANAKSLIASGAAIFDEDPRRLAEVVRRALSRPGKLKQMREASSALSRPHAARHVAQRVAALLGWSAVADSGRTPRAESPEVPASDDRADETPTRTRARP